MPDPPVLVAVGTEPSSRCSPLLGRAAVLFEVGIAVPANIGRLRGRLRISWLGLVTFATLVTTKGAFAKTAAGQRRTACVIARLGRVILILAREGAAVLNNPVSPVSEDPRGRISVGWRCVVRLGL